MNPAQINMGPETSDELPKADITGVINEDETDAITGVPGAHDKK